jgi:hypothetical protein|tara:strand:+ start:50 stop:469 length:420 start_codon:yes stop_codon:yes gene_type:complete
MAKITITKTKGEFLNLLKGLFSVLHIKGKDFSFTVRDNILVIKEALSGYIFDVPPEDYRMLMVQFKTILASGAEDADEQIKAIKLANPEAVQERETQLQELEVALDISISLELDTLSRSILTEEITADNLLSINEFIED